ncbi:hypothetical protein ACFGVR_23670 [Mucilaginibacter sp. AW1-3]
MKLSITMDLQQINNLYTKIIERKVYRTGADYHFDTLLIIAKNKGMVTRKKLAKLLRLSLTQTNAIIYALHAEGLIYLMPNNTYITEAYVALTPKGDENVQQIESEIKLLNEKITTGIADEKLENFLEILETLKLNLKRESAVTAVTR